MLLKRPIMNPQLYRAAQGGDWDVIRRFETHLYTQKTANGNTALHVVAEFCDSAFAAEQILLVAPKLLMQLNAQGENSLHIAARAGHFNVILALKAAAQQRKKGYWYSMLKACSRNGNSVLYEAANKNRLEIVRFLLEECPVLKTSRNSIHGSPLYVAVEKGYEDVAALILSNCNKRTKPRVSNFYALLHLLRYYMVLAVKAQFKPNREDAAYFQNVVNLTAWDIYDGPGLRTALHAAARRNLPECAKSLLEKFHDLTKSADEYGWTPLHVAARFNYQEVAKVLLIADPLMAYAKSRPYNCEDEDGQMTALHVAVTHGHLETMKEILLHCPDCWEMVTQRGKNVIHLAVKHEQEQVLQFILMEPWASKLVNEKDCKGNTPLHLYVVTNNLNGCNLINHFEVDKNALNSAGLTPLDMITDAMDQAEERRNELEGSRAIHGYPNVASTKKDTEEEDYGSTGENYKLVLTLIITVTFAAGFTIPGGYDQGNDPKTKGMAVLIDKYAFKLFIAADVGAMMISTLVLWILVIPAKSSNRFQQSLKLKACKVGIGLALFFLIISFAAGIYVTTPYRRLRILLIFLSGVLGLIVYLFAIFASTGLGAGLGLGILSSPVTRFLVFKIKNY